MMDVRALVEKSGDAELLREMIGFAAERLMELEVGAKTGADYGEKSPERLAQRNGYRDRDWQARAGSVELRIPRLRTGSYFPSFLEPRRSVEKALAAVIQEAYARVSTASQDLEIQKAKLNDAGCEIIRAETASGASMAGRTELKTILDFLRTGDRSHRLDRLGRSTRDVLNLVHELESRGASLRILDPEVTTAGPAGRMVVTVLGMVADMELQFIRERQRAGIEAAKGRGVYKGRRKQVDDTEIRKMAEAGAAKSKIARELGVSRMTVYRALKKGKSVI